MFKHIIFLSFIFSLFIFAGCTVGEKDSNSTNNNNTNNNNTNNNNTNNNNTNNTNNQNYSPEHPSSMVEGFWKITQVDVVLNTIDGSQIQVITPIGATINDPDGSTYEYSVYGSVYFEAIDDNNINTHSLVLFAKDKFLTTPTPTLVDMSATASADGSDVSIVFESDDGSDLEYSVTRTNTTLELNYVQTGDSSPSPDIIQKMIFTYVSDTPQKDIVDSNIDNMTLVDTDDSSVLLTTDTWAYMADGYYYQIKSTVTVDEYGLFTWYYAWDYSVDENGDPVEGTKTYSRKGFVWVDSSNATFFFTDFDDTNTNLITIQTSVTTGDSTNSTVYSVQNCYDSESENCDLWNPVQFQFTAQ